MKYENYSTDYEENSPISESRKVFLEKSRDEFRDTHQPVYKKPVNEIRLSILQENLAHCLEMIDDEIMKGYLGRLEEFSVIPLEEGKAEALQDIHFFKITELVYQEEEFSVHKLSTVFHALSNKPCTLVLMIRSDGLRNHFYLGVRSRNEKYSSGTMMQMLKQSLLGMFPGSQIEPYYDEDMLEVQKQEKKECLSCATCIADFKQEEQLDNRSFVQGLEKFVYSMRGKAYTAYFIGDSLGQQELLKMKEEYEKIYSQISPFADMQINFSISDSRGEAQGNTQGISYNQSKGNTTGSSSSYSGSVNRTTGTTHTKGTSDMDTRNQSSSEGITDTVGVSKGSSYSETDSHSEGTFQSVGITAGIVPDILGIGGSVGRSESDTHSETVGRSRTDSLSNSVSKTLSHGISQSRGSNQSVSESDSEGISWTAGESYQRGDSFTEGTGVSLTAVKTLTDTFGNSRGVTLNARNMTLRSTLQRIEKHLKRMEECESLGMWNFAAYFLGESAAETETAASTYQAIVSGMQSGVERAAVNTWTEENDLKKILAYVDNFLHPCFAYQRFSYDTESVTKVSPAAMVSTNELALHMGVPRFSVPGLPVIEHAAFGQEVLSRYKKEGRKITLGKIHHMGENFETEVNLDLESLSMHTFIAGSTGAGKSNAVYHLLDQARKSGISFLIIEPAKGEYRKVFPEVRCFGTNPNIDELLRINPFSFPKEVHVLEHIDRIIEIFNVCWPMYAAMPAVLKESIERAYISVGWDLELSENIEIEGLYPTFEDVVRELNSIIRNSDYSDDTKGDYIGSLSTRLRSLTNGINGRIFVGDEIDLKLLFDQEAILDISRVGSMETKALIMGIIVLKLQEYRMAGETEMNQPLKHLTVLEEAHNLLKKTSSEQGQDSSNLQGKSVEMLTNTIAEIRTYGEGFVIVDQAPNLLDTAAIRNTNTKLIFRLPEGHDREITGMAMGLHEKQIQEISKLPTGVAVVYQNDWQEAVLCHLPKYAVHHVEKPLKRKKSPFSKRDRNNQILHILLQDCCTEEDKQKLRSWLLKENLAGKIRKDLLYNLESRNLVYEWAVADFIDKNYRTDHIFRGTGQRDWETLNELIIIAQNNIKDEFEDFTELEMKRIIYYICHIQHEKFPENRTIEQMERKLKLEGGIQSGIF